jgi:hypothetical protein
VLLLRYLDVCLVAATAPFVAIGGLPAFGYAVGACAWILTRAGVAFAYDRARHSDDARLRAGLAVGSMMARVWLIVVAVIVARYAGSKQDGVMAAALVLAAFTVYLAMSFVLRPTASGGRARGRPSTS